MQIPSVGRIVHYKAYGTPGGEYPSVARAAIVTEVHSDTVVGLAILNPTGMFFNQRVEFGDKPGQWSWMPFVPAKKDEVKAPEVGSAVGSGVAVTATTQVEKPAVDPDVVHHQSFISYTACGIHISSNRGIKTAQKYKDATCEKCKSA